MTKHADIDSLLRKGEIALSRAKLADSDPPKPQKRGRDELISVSEIAEEVTGAAVRSAIEAREGGKHGEISTPFGFSYKGPLAMLPWLILAGLLVWHLISKK